MQTTFFVRCVLVSVVFQVVIEATIDDPPRWITPDPKNPELTLNIAASNACNKVTGLTAYSGDKSTVNISFVSQNPDGGFSIGKDMYGDKILKCTKEAITKPSYKVVVRAQHVGGNAKETNLVLTITVKGLTEPAAPVFVKPDPDNGTDEHMIYIPETVQAGDEVLTLTATDSDTNDALLTFNMDESSSVTKELFEIDADTQKLKVRGDVAMDYFNCEKKSAVLEYPITLAVSDGALNTTLSTTIYVRDVNDNYPVFSGNFTAVIPQTAVAGYSVLNLTVTDNDLTAANNQVNLTLSGAPEFEIVGKEILVAVSANFSAGTNQSYTLNVTASDDAPEDPKSTDQEFIIKISPGTGNGTTEGTNSTSSGSNNSGLIIGVLVAVCVSVAAPVGVGFPSYKACPPKKKLNLKNGPEMHEQNADVRTDSEMHYRNIEDVVQEECSK